MSVPSIPEQNLAIWQIAERTGYSVRTVTDSLRLLSLPPDAQRLLADGMLGVGEATELAKQVATKGSGEVTRNHAANGWFNPGHALAAAARRSCTHRDEVPRTRKIVGDIACGPCWESVIRADERANPSGGAS